MHSLTISPTHEVKSSEIQLPLHTTVYTRSFTQTRNITKLFQKRRWLLKLTEACHKMQLGIKMKYISACAKCYCYVHPVHLRSLSARFRLCKQYLDYYAFSKQQTWSMFSLSKSISIKVYTIHICDMVHFYVVPQNSFVGINIYHLIIISYLMSH